MKHLLLSLVFLLSIATIARAEDNENQNVDEQTVSDDSQNATNFESDGIAVTPESGEFETQWLNPPPGHRRPPDHNRPAPGNPPGYRPPPPHNPPGHRPPPPYNPPGHRPPPPYNPPGHRPPPPYNPPGYRPPPPYNPPGYRPPPPYNPPGRRPPPPYYPPNPYPSTQYINCDSRGYNYAECYVGGYIRNAGVYQQHSRSDCQYGYSWGIYNDRIWVDHGCRATFWVESGYYR